MIVYKVVAWRLLDRDDVEKLLMRHGERIDLAPIRRLVAEFAAILEAPERLLEFDGLVKSALAGGASLPAGKPKGGRRGATKERPRRRRS